ncbi:glycosyl hydrolase family 18 protein [Terriglobus tenax]|uniref:glycosyl hydrolase family 18 protein n=1 Tax=Terriglobus tenax TaxID=1111115 RepID=UPI0021DF6107|nr:glycosyl hydrolase family 18 protein [Terriglobus tenax]
MKLLAALLLLASSAFAQPAKSMLYLRNNQRGIDSFLAHRRQIDILVPTWYQVDADGHVTGAPNPTILSAARQSHIAVVPIVALFNKDAAHHLLTTPAAEDSFANGLLVLCREHHYTGIQLDIENILATDRDPFTAMVRKLSEALHREHFELQIAVVPPAPGQPGETAFGRWIWEEWRGVFDLKAIAPFVDAIGLMTYDQHTRYTMPGPVAGWNWTRQNLDYALAQGVPRNKLYLGIALYGYHWFTGDPMFDHKEPHPNLTADYISWRDSMQLLHTYAPGRLPQWDADEHTEWFYFYRDQMREYIFLTGRRTFADRYRLAQQEHLAGFCSWVLGEEDPAIWQLLPKH